MKKWCVLAALMVGLSSAPAQAKTVTIAASPNPAPVAAHVRHTVVVGAMGRLDAWVSATGFRQPGSGTLPPGVWSFECCPSQVAGTSAWHYRSLGLVPPGSYRFNAVARTRGNYVSTAWVASGSASVSIRIS